MRRGLLTSAEWVAANHLSVLIYKNEDFSITAAKEWVKKNCPSLLEEDRLYCPLPDDENECYNFFGQRFLNYDKGVKYVD